MIISYTWNLLFGNLQNALACSICSPSVCDQWMQKIVLRLSDTMSFRFGAFNGDMDPMSKYKFVPAKTAVTPRREDRRAYPTTGLPPGCQTLGERFVILYLCQTISLKWHRKHAE